MRNHEIKRIHLSKDISNDVITFEKWRDPDCLIFYHNQFLASLMGMLAKQHSLIKISLNSIE